MRLARVWTDACFTVACLMSGGIPNSLQIGAAVELRQTRGKGIGAFAATDIPGGSFLCR